MILGIPPVFPAKFLGKNRDKTHKNKEFKRHRKKQQSSQVIVLMPVSYKPVLVQQLNTNALQAASYYTISATATANQPQSKSCQY